MYTVGDRFPDFTLKAVVSADPPVMPRYCGKRVIIAGVMIERGSRLRTGLRDGG